MHLHISIILGFVLLLVPSPGWAHSSPFSYLDLNVRDNEITGSLVVHSYDVAHDLGVESAERLLEPQVAAALHQRLVALLTLRLTIRTDGVLAPEWQGLDVLPERSGLRLTFRFPVPRPAWIRVRARLFPYDPVHQTFLNVYEDGQLRQQRVFTRDTSEQVYYAGTTDGVLAVMRTFIPSGVHHILIGPDHILFLLGLLLLGGTWGTLVKIVSAFTIGHSITLSLAALDVLAPPAQIVEPAIALSIVFVGADNLMRGTGKDVRAWVALVFGLVHGFGFANVLKEFGLPPEALGWSLFSFNAGVEIGQLSVVLLAATALVLVRRRSEFLEHRIAQVGSIGVIAAGAYWFVERLQF